MTGVLTVPGSVALRCKLTLAAPALNQAMGALWHPADLGARYLRYLSVMHTVIRASVPLMQTAVVRCRELDDAVAGPLADYLTHHIDEELNHDDWLLEDLAAAGVDPTPTVTDQPSPTVARLVGPQYYWIAHHHPVSLLGYIAVLEGNSPPPWLAGRLAADTGLPDAAFRTLHHHAVADLDHNAELDDFIDSLALSAGHQRAMSVSALSTVDLLTEVFLQLNPAGPSGARSVHADKSVHPER